MVNSFVYLGSVFTSDGRCEKEIKGRIGIAKTAFTSMSKDMTLNDDDMINYLSIIHQWCYKQQTHKCYNMLTRLSKGFRVQGAIQILYIIDYRSIIHQGCYKQLTHLGSSPLSI